MPRRRRILISLILLTGLGLALWWWTGREPSYQGKKLSEWCDLGIAMKSERFWPEDESVSASRMSTERSRATNAIFQLGSRALPWMMRWESDSFVRGDSREAKLVDWASGIGLFKGWSDQYVTRRMRAARLARDRARFILYSLRANAASVVPQFMDRVEARKDSYELVVGNERPFLDPICEYVVVIGPTALPSVMPYLNHSSAHVRWISRDIVRRWGDSAIGAGPALAVQLANTSDGRERSNIVLVLSDIGYRPNPGGPNEGTDDGTAPLQ